jgi:hypothetical protein
MTRERVVVGTGTIQCIGFRVEVTKWLMSKSRSKEVEDYGLGAMELVSKLLDRQLHSKIVSGCYDYKVKTKIQV